MRGFVLLLLLPTRLIMEYQEGDAVHLAGNGGAIDHEASSVVEVELRGKKAVVTDAGTWSEHNLYENFSTDEKAIWRNVWWGTFTEDASGLALDLALHGTSCTRQKTESGAQPETKPCAAIDAKVSLRCTAATVAQGSRRVAVWRCAPANGESLGESPSTWVLGKPGCVQMLGGRRSEASYQRCTGH